MRQTIIRSTGAAFLGGALLFLTACGGGGGGSSGGSVAYDGRTEKAVVTEDNVQDLVEAAVAGAEVGGELGFLGGGIALRAAALAPAQAWTSPLGAGRRVAELLDQALTPSGRTYRRVAVDESMAGSCGGSARIRGSADDETGAFQGTFTFQEFCEEDTRISGSISMVGQVDLDTGDFGQLSLTISRLTIRDAVDDVSMGGTLAFTFQDSASTAVMTMTVRDNNAGEAIRLENFTVTTAEVAGGDRITVAGRTFHSAHGHVDVTTPTPFFIGFSDENPSSGELLAEGANATWARLTAVSATQCLLEADTTGDGTADYSELLFWDDL